VVIHTSIVKFTNIEFQQLAYLTSSYT
ncbi:hypothetical protein FWK35_00010395, partial [Aphis craccivora]